MAYTFWPDSSEDQARTNLRNLLHILRQTLPECDRFIDIDTQTLQWREDAPFNLDVLEFERNLAPASRTPASQEKLDQAVRLYQGDLLPGCYDDWINPERERLRRAFLAALEALAETAEHGRNYQHALEYTHRLLQAEPLHAAGNRQLVRLYSLLKNRSAALKAYRTYANKLERELDIRPDQETQDLADFLRQGVGKENQLSTEEAQTILVGRQLEWRKLHATWQSAVNGSPQAVFVTGEAGIGKTRLVEELVQWASRQGIRTATANCYLAEGSLPYSPAVSWLRSLSLPPLEDIWLIELSRLMPEILQARPKLTQPTALSEAWQRQRLFEALSRAVLGNRRKLLLVLEDIHWCDQDTLEWIHYLLRFDAHAPVMIVATKRIEEIVTPDHPLESLQAALQGAGKYTEIELKPLSMVESFQLAVQVAKKGTNQDLDPDLTEHIYRQTEGNPLFVVEMVHLGQIVPSQGLPPGDAAEPSGKAQAVLKRRINQITPATREVVSLAATIGREFNLDILHNASEESEENMLKALDELLRRRIIQETSLEGYDFTHDKLRQAVLTELSTAHRRILHRRIAQVYLSMNEAESHPRHADIAGHYEAAGMSLQAIQHYRLAAETAAHLFANAEARRHLLQAVNLAGALGVSEPGGFPAIDYARLLERLGELQALNGQNTEAQATLEQALTQYPSAPGLWRAQIFRKISTTWFQQQQYPRAFAALDQAELALNLPAGGSTLEERQEWLQIQLARGEMFYWDNQPEQIDACVQRISPMVETDGRMDQQSGLLSLQIMTRIRRERFRLSQETVDIARRRLELVEKFTDAYLLAFAQFQLGFVLLWHGDPGAALEWVQKGFEVTERIGARVLQVRCLAYLDILSRKLGDLELLRQQNQQLLEQTLAIGEHGYYGITLANQGWLAWREGDLENAVKGCQTALAYWQQNAGEYAFRSSAAWVLLAVAVTRQDLPEAVRWGLMLVDPNPAFQPVLEPMIDLLREALSAWQMKNGAAALQGFTLALEQAGLAGEL